MTREISATGLDQSGITAIIIGTSIYELADKVLLIAFRRLLSAFKHWVRLVHRSIIVFKFDFRERSGHFLPIFRLLLTIASSDTGWGDSSRSLVSWLAGMVLLRQVVRRQLLKWEAMLVLQLCFVLLGVNKHSLLIDLVCVKVALKHWYVLLLLALVQRFFLQQLSRHRRGRGCLARILLLASNATRGSRWVNTITQLPIRA